MLKLQLNDKIANSYFILLTLNGTFNRVITLSSANGLDVMESNSCDQYW